MGISFLPLAPLTAQDATVQGRVRDDEGAAVFRATVVLLRSDTPVVASDTDRLGSFRIVEVAPAPYTVRVRGLGYAEHSEEIVIGPTETVELDLRLQRSALQIEGISVEAERSRTRARFEQVGGTTIRDLDIDVVRAVPGFVEPDPVRVIEVLPGVVSTSDFSAAFHVRGGSQDQNLILLDGMPIFSPFHLGGVFSVFNADMIDRVELYSGGFSAEHGGRSLVRASGRERRRRRGLLGRWSSLPHRHEGGRGQGPRKLYRERARFREHALPGVGPAFVPRLAR